MSDNAVKTQPDFSSEKSSSEVHSNETQSIKMKKEISPKQRDELLAALKGRFDANKARHPGLVWAKVQARLAANPDKLPSLAEMERTGGEPDVVGQDKKSGEFVFMDCSAQSPKSRVSFCYDREALDGRKEHKSVNQAFFTKQPFRAMDMPSTLQEIPWLPSRPMFSMKPFSGRPEFPPPPQ
jgi:hypothetical protein